MYNVRRPDGIEDRERRATAHRWTAEEDAVLRQGSPNRQPYGELEHQLGLTFEQIRTRAKRLGIRSRQALALAGVQHDFFALQTPETAYFAGLLAADGWIATPKPAVCLALKEPDRDMVDRFVAAVSASREVRVYAGQAVAAVCSSQMVADLGDRWSVHPSKTDDLLPPTVDLQELRIAYAAGHLDGDGFIGGRRSPRSASAVIRCGAIGTEPVIRWIADTLDAILAEAGRPPVRVRQVGARRYATRMFEWRTSDHNAVIVLDAMKTAIGDLGIRRKWAALETARAALSAHPKKGAA